MGATYDIINRSYFVVSETGEGGEIAIRLTKEKEDGQEREQAQILYVNVFPSLWGVRLEAIIALCERVLRWSKQGG